MTDFTVYPAIDLRNGTVVRLRQGDPDQQTTYSNDPLDTAKGWVNSGADWLHVVSLDGAFGDSDFTNIKALVQVIESGARIQFGGGLRDLDSIQHVLDLGVSRVVLGTVAVTHPQIVDTALALFGPDKIAIGVDARNGVVKVKGWQEETTYTAVQLTERLKIQGVRWMVFTDISRDGVGTGLNLEATISLAEKTGLNVIASGGVNTSSDVLDAQSSGLAGAIVGRALYEGRIDLAQLLANVRKSKC